MFTTFLTSLLILGTIQIFRKFKPVEKSNFQTDLSKKELAKKYRSTDLKQLGLFFLITPLLTIVVFYCFTGLRQVQEITWGNVLYVVPMDKWAILIAAMFTAIYLTALLLDVIIRRQVANLEEYMAHNNLKYGFDYDRVSRFLNKVLAIICSLLILAFFDWYMVLTTDGLRVNGLLGAGEKKYEYSEVQEIRGVAYLKATNGDIVKDRHLKILFKDGRKWNSRREGPNSKKSNDRLVEILQTKTGKKETLVEFDAD